MHNFGSTADRAQVNGWHVVREFVVAESAKRGSERRAFNEMFAWVKANAKREKIKAILSHKLDRVCRNMRDAVRLQELEDICGVQLAFSSITSWPASCLCTIVQCHGRGRPASPPTTAVRKLKRDGRESTAGMALMGSAPPAISMFKIETRPSFRIPTNRECWFVYLISTPQAAIHSRR